MSNYKMNFATKTLTITKAFAEMAMRPNTAEANLLAQMNTLLPDLKISYKTHIGKPHPYKGLTNKRMESYIKLHENADELMETFEAVKAIVDADRDWVPDVQGTSLYIRPFIISPEPSMAVHPASKYWFIIILSPVAAYYEGNDKELHGSRIWVEEEFIRAAVGGTGFAKCGGNYSCGMIAATEAKKQGCEEVLWLDAKEHKYVEEVGTSNAFFKINGTVYTSSLTGSILPGVTRDSAIRLMRKWGEDVVEKRLEIDDLLKAAADGSLTEAWATGTACVVSPIGLLRYRGENYPINGEKVGELSQKLYDTLYGMQTGIAPDVMGDWVVTL